MWKLTYLEGAETLREFYFPSKPSYFLLADYGISDRGISNLLRGASADTEYGEWWLDEIEVLYDAVDEHAQTWEEFTDIITSITYKPGWYFRTGVEQGRMWVQVGVTEEAEISFDPIEGKKVPWRGAKHYLSPHMCRQEIVSTVLHAIERAEMHEVHEWFRYKGRSIYNPHLDPDALVEVARYARNFNTRKNAMTMSDG